MIVHDEARLLFFDHPRRREAARFDHCPRLEGIRAEAKATLVPVGTAAIAARAKVTAESLIDEAEEVRVGAMRSHQYNAANGAIKNKSVLTGVWVERAEIGGPGDFDHLTDDDLERLLVERLGALGLSVEILPTQH